MEAWEGTCECRGIGLGITPLLGVCAPTREAGVTVDYPLAPHGRGDQMGSVDMLGIGLEPLDVLAELRIDLLEKPAHKLAGWRDAAGNVG